MQYRANDDGRIQRPFVVRAATTAPWLWAGTGLVDGATFGEELGGYGIEIDQTTPLTPPGTIVLAEIPDLFGPGLTAQMTYYETANGGEGVRGGALDFGGSATLWPDAAGCSKTSGRAWRRRRGRSRLNDAELAALRRPMLFGRVLRRAAVPPARNRKGRGARGVAQVPGRLGARGRHGQRCRAGFLAGGHR